jgi:Type II secretion system (T2SS), protein G
MELTNSKRVILSVSYVTTELTPDEQRGVERKPGRALEKLNQIRQLRATREELASVERVVEQETDRDVRRGLAGLVQLGIQMAREERGAGSNLVLAQQVAAVSSQAIVRFSELIAEARESSSAKFLSAAFQLRMKTAPVGRLHLERIEMYPVGIEKGELVFTVPLAPKETATISHKEWATSGEEYERIIQDQFESYSERGVAEKTDFSMSSENETRHSNAFNFTASASGGYGPVSLTVSTGLSTTSDDRQAVQESAKRNREVTEKASARTRQEHKVSVKLETKRGVEDSSFRTITNPHEDRALRIDYYRMMRKWRTDLFRYGLRLTFDIAIPNPGARLWTHYRRLHELDQAIGEPFEFPLKPETLPESGWQAVATTYGATIDPPPPTTVTISISRALQDPHGGNEIFDFVAPDGYVMRLNPVICEGIWAGNLDPNSSVGPPSTPYVIFPPNTTMTPQPNTESVPGMVGGSLRLDSQGLGGGKHASWFLIYMPVNRLLVDVRMDAVRLDTTLAAWRAKSWTTLRDAAFAAYQANIARLQGERDQLWMLLTGKDTLTLRRLEREELIRQTLHWLIGPDFDEAPDDVTAAVKHLLDIEAKDRPDQWPGGGAAYRHLNQMQWSTAAGFGDFLKFIHQAIEWENILYFLYPYFWGSDDLGREKLLFDHPDPTHRDFLRAGYARVVVPIRPGFEEDFTDLVDTGIFSGASSSPYLSIASEVAAFARTNYAGVPPANPEKHARPLLYPEQRQTWETMQEVVPLLAAHYSANNAYPPDLSSLPGAPFLDAWGRPLVYLRPGSGNDYDLLSYGADGAPGGEGLEADISAGAGASLVASWFDYTPTSGIDIEVNAKLEDVA